MRTKFYILSFFLIFAFHSGISQSFQIDYLEIQNHKDNKKKVDLIVVFFDKYYSPNFNDSHASAQSIIKSGYTLSKQINYPKGIINTSHRLGQLLIFEKKLDKALPYFFDCIKTSEIEKDTSYYVKSMLNLGVIYYIQKKYITALEYFNKAIENKGITNNEKHTLAYLIGLSYSEIKEYPKAIINLNIALKEALVSQKMDRVNECYLGLGHIYVIKKEFITAKQYLSNALNYYREKQSEHAALARVYEELSQIALGEKNEKLALTYALEAYKHSKKTPDANNLFEITDILQKLYFHTGDINQAYKYLLENKTLKDSLYSSDISTEITMAMSKYEFEKKENVFAEELLTRKRKTNLAYFLTAIVGVFLIGAAISVGFLRKERKKSEKLILNILPAETAMELKKHGKAIPRKHESVSIMFCDVRQFTLISEKLDPETLVAMLDHYISNFDNIISKHGLEKIKTIGDAYMCAGGLHSGFDDHAIKIINAAIEILDFVKEINPEMQAKFGHAFEFRIGIHTGPVVSGVVGYHKYAYDIWGDTVNIAARMEEKSEPGEINISGVTYSMVFNKFEARFRGMIEAKNKAPMEMYYVNKRSESNI